MNEEQSFVLVIACLREGLGNVFKEHQLSAVSSRSIEIIAGSSANREDDSTTAKQFSRVGDGLSMIAAAYGDDARSACRIEFRENLVERATNLECACCLKDLEFQVDIRAEHVAQRAATNGRCSFDVWTDALTRLLHVVDRNHLVR